MMQTNKLQWKTPLISFLACVGMSTLVAFITVAINSGFGARDLLPLLTWTLAFAAIITLVAQWLIATLVKMPAFLRYGLAGASGSLAGVFWTCAVSQLLGPWLSAFSLPILFCWIAGGAAGISLAMLYHESRRRAALITVPVILILSLSSWTLSKSFGGLLSREQQLEVLVIKWHPSPTPLANTDVPGLSKSDLEHLRAIGLTGEVKYSSSGKFGEGQQARAIIVTQSPLSEPVNLPQPYGAEVIYIQSESGWNRYPQEARTSQRQIRLWSDPNGSSQNTLFSVERADGSKQGGTAATW